MGSATARMPASAPIDGEENRGLAFVLKFLRGGFERSSPAPFRLAQESAACPTSISRMRRFAADAAAGDGGEIGDWFERQILVLGRGTIAAASGCSLFCSTRAAAQ